MKSLGLLMPLTYHTQLINLPVPLCRALWAPISLGWRACAPVGETGYPKQALKYSNEAECSNNHRELPVNNGMLTTHFYLPSVPSLVKITVNGYKKSTNLQRQKEQEKIQRVRNLSGKCWGFRGKEKGRWGLWEPAPPDSCVWEDGERVAQMSAQVPPPLGDRRTAAEGRQAAPPSAAGQRSLELWGWNQHNKWQLSNCVALGSFFN